MGVGAWAVALIVLSIGDRGRRSDVLALAGGLLFGITCFLSFGLALLVTIPLAVAWAERRVRPLAVAAVGGVAVALVFLAAGYWWLDGFATAREQYLAAVSISRPYGYFLVNNLAAFAIAAGPALAIALWRLRDRRLWLLVGGAAAAIAIAQPERDVEGRGGADLASLPALDHARRGRPAAGSAGASGPCCAPRRALRSRFRSPWGRSGEHPGADPGRRRRRVRRLARGRRCWSPPGAACACSTPCTRSLTPADAGLPQSARPSTCGPTSATATRCWRRSTDVDAVSHQAAMVGLGIEVGDLPTTSPTTASAPRSCSRRCTPGGSPAGWCSPAAWSSTERAATGARTTAWSARARARSSAWPPRV